MPIVLVTHDMGEAQALADSLCVLDEGDTLQVGSPAAVLGAPASARVRHALDIE
jgi:ABC-type proline/glycine betaine transport system ATPase subunit